MKVNNRIHRNLLENTIGDSNYGFIGTPPLIRQWFDDKDYTMR